MNFNGFANGVFNGNILFIGRVGFEEIDQRRICVISRKWWILIHNLTQTGELIETFNWKKKQQNMSLCHMGILMINF